MDHRELAEWKQRAAKQREDTVRHYTVNEQDLKVIEAKRLMESIVTGTPVGATIADAARAATIAEAAARSVETEGWVTL